MLPPQLTERLLQLEVRLSADPRLETLIELLDLYSVTAIQAAIEHYEERQDPAYLLYKEQLRNVLRREDVISLYDASGELSARLHSEAEILQITPEAPPLPICEKRRVEGLVSRAENIRDTLKKVTRDVFTQIHKLTSRLRERRKRHSLQASSGLVESDAGAGGSSTFEIDLERLLDGHLRVLSERESALAQQCLSEPLLSLALTQLRLEAESQKRAEVAKLKAKYRI